MEKGKKCVACAGSGEVANSTYYNDPDYRPCQTCEGTGEIKNKAILLLQTLSNYNGIEYKESEEASILSVIENYFKEVRKEATEKEAGLWERYADACRVWRIANQDDPHSMKAGMTEPNRPHYTRANND